MAMLTLGQDEILELDMEGMLKVSQPAVHWVLMVVKFGLKTLSCP